MTGGADGLSRLSLNQKTTELWSVEEAAAGCVRAGIGWIGLWREQVRAAGGAEAAGRIVREAGLRVSSYCRGGFFTADSDEEWRRAVDENRRVAEESAALDCDTVVLVCGGMRGSDLDVSRRQVRRESRRRSRRRRRTGCAWPSNRCIPCSAPTGR